MSDCSREQRCSFFSLTPCRKRTKDDIAKATGRETIDHRAELVIVETVSAVGVVGGQPLGHHVDRAGRGAHHRTHRGILDKRERLVGRSVVHTKRVQRRWWRGREG